MQKALSTDEARSSWRAEMPVTAKWTYFDHAAVAPLPRKTAQALKQYADTASAHGDAYWLDWAREIENTRRRAATLINAAPEQIAFVPNTTTAIGLLAEGFPWQAGDNVVLPAEEFPSNQYPWLNLQSRGVEVRRVVMPPERLDLDLLRAACDQRTRVISLSWVGYASGWRTDVAAATQLAHDCGAVLCLDAIQGLGVYPLDVQQVPVDFLAADSHKWLLGPEGAGFCYIRPELLARLRPINVGWGSVTQGVNYQHIEMNWKPTASRYEGGAWNMPGLLAMGQSLQLFLDLGVANIEQLVLNFTTELCEALQRAGATLCSLREQREHASGIVAFRWHDFDPTAVRNHCLTQGIVMSQRAGRLRASPHGYADQADIERLIGALQNYRV
jgi:cysteine desulfurase / selenocysteine lyase